MRFSDLAGRRVVVWGYGLEGRSVLARCRELGIDAVAAVPDLADEAEPPARDVLVGTAAGAALERADVVVKSPGIPATDPRYRTLARSGTTFTSLTDLWLSDNADRAIGVTGTKGKSTTASAIAHLLAALGEPAIAAGNIGVSLLELPAEGPAVLEVSSYQAQSLSTSPRVAVVTSLYPEHLPWHGGFEQYAADKLRLVAHGPAHVVVPERDSPDNERLRDLVEERLTAATQVRTPGPTTWHVAPDGTLQHPGVPGVSDPVEIPATALPLRGRHNAVNLALALLAVEAYLGDAAPSPVELAGALRTFAPLAHRMEVVPSRDQRIWVDDSLATAPEAVVAALETARESWPDRPAVVLLGGADRGLDFSPLVTYLTSRNEPLHLLLLGPAGQRFEQEHVSAQGIAPHTAQWWPSMAGAVTWALDAADPRAVVLLSPGAPSFDAYRDYADRARHLRELVAPSP